MTERHILRTYDISSMVEKLALAKSGRKLHYAPAERVGVIEVPDFPSLGRLAALRFIEWLQRNPGGVISLPTGKTPEHFISWTSRLLHHWKEKDIQDDLGSWGLDPTAHPDMRSFVFVQIDEFFPMDPAQENSFAAFIRRFYLKGFGLDPAKALLMDAWTVGAPDGKDLGDIFGDERVDLSLRHRRPATEREELQAAAIAAADQAAMEYEARIEELGGIGFFLGGIGPDGHVGFNIRGSDHFTTTRIIPINYETAAAAATDLGGIEVSRHKVVLTVGLQTITRNPSTTAVIIAAGETKAGVVRDAVEETPSVRYPGTVLQKLPAARCYLTRGAASLLAERRREDLRRAASLAWPQVERILTDIAVSRKKTLADLAAADLAADRLGSVLIRRQADVAAGGGSVAEAMRERIARGTAPVTGKRFLHTAPHHDDIMLGYLPLIVHLVRNPENSHFFATLTSGFTSVTNAYAHEFLEDLRGCLDRGLFDELFAEGYFSAGNILARNRDIYQYLDGVAAKSPEMMTEGEARRALRDLVELTGASEAAALKRELGKLTRYLATAYPGRKDPPDVQTLKGMIREWEEELLWAHLGFNCEHIRHLRLGFYTGDIFTPQPEFERDVKPILALIEETKPDILTVALDPESSGPDTHYKVLQAVAEALREYLHGKPERIVEVWGYRNVWFRFHPSEANLYVPVSMNSLAIMRSAFETCFGSQRSASFPSHEYDGPFSDLAQKIMVEQYAAVKTCLGRSFFAENPVPRLRATRGMCFLRVMTPSEFFSEAAALRRLTESRD